MLDLKFVKNRDTRILEMKGVLIENKQIGEGKNWGKYHNKRITEKYFFS